MPDQCHAFNLLITERKLDKFKVYLLCVCALWTTGFVCVMWEGGEGITFYYTYAKIADILIHSLDLLAAAGFFNLLGKLY